MPSHDKREKKIVTLEEEKIVKWVINNKENWGKKEEMEEDHIKIEELCHKLHSVISPPILRRFPQSQSQLKALKKTFRSMPVMSRGNQ